ncbi:MAG: UDP-2,3-diacylglucosamine diphosphatase [Bacteroidetes bacterium]|nr:MAG: UDP-2,3-diacylglucosamine diphosphatase [Bacteroidota bacterium]
MSLNAGKKIYFASDFHLGVPTKAASLEREKRIVRWLDEVKKDAAEIWLMGDIFDFWFEYKHTVPKGYTRLLGKLAELSDAGIKLFAFSGNHDMWMFGYFEEELNIPVYHEPITREWNGKRFYLGHGDGLGPGDHGYKFIKKVFRNRLCQILFSMLPASWGIGLANYFSGRSRHANGDNDAKYLGDDQEWLMIYCKEILAQEHFDFFVFGHRHLPLDKPVSDTSRYINLGDWIRYNTYGVFDGEEFSLLTYKG